MWLATLGRRDFLETLASGPSSETCEAAKETAFSSSAVLRLEPNHVLVGWEVRPYDRVSFPVLAILPGDQIRDMLAAVNASPKAISPLSAFCRIISVEQAQSCIAREISASTAPLVNAVAMLSLAEVQLHSRGRMKARQVGPAACRRTLSFAWARALSVGMRPAEMADLPRKWLEAYDICNVGSSEEERALPVHYVIPVLQAAASFVTGAGQSPVLRLMEAIVSSDNRARDDAWRDLSNELPVSMTLQDLEKAPREERGSYLQQTFETSSRLGSHSDRQAAQGFLATQIAPGSLEHLDLLMQRSGPGTAFWYVLFAALQNPAAVMNAYGGLGRRVSRDIRGGESLDTVPRADVALDELKILTRYGTEELSRKAGHSNEIEVELMPLVTATYRLARSQPAKASSETSSDRASDQQVVSNLRQISVLLNRTISELSEQPQDIERARPSRKKPTF
jgi:hypothetical protein